MMKNTFRVMIGAAAAAAMVSCGGGGDVAGDSSEFAVSPTEFALKLGAGSRCRDASEMPPVVVTIIGGQPPFRIVNADPEALIVDKTEAAGKDPQFRITYSPNAVICVNPGVITILDYHSQVASFEFKVEIDEAQ